jgi:hypothetical protein
MSDQGLWFISDVNPTLEFLTYHCGLIGDKVYNRSEFSCASAEFPLFLRCLFGGIWSIYGFGFVMHVLEHLDSVFLLSLFGFGVLLV